MRESLYYFVITTIIVIVGIIYIQSFWKLTLSEWIHQNAYQIIFEEGYFLPIPIQKQKYQIYTKYGYNIMKKQRIVFAGLAYNLGKKKTNKLVKRLRYLGSFWKDYRVIIYTEDSTDGTFQFLKNLIGHDFRWILLPHNINKIGLPRLVRLAKLRNTYLRELHRLSIRKDEHKYNYDVVAIIDCDLAGPFSNDGIANSISHFNQNSYDVLFANGLYSQIGTFYFPHLGWTYYDIMPVVLIDQIRNTDGTYQNKRNRLDLVMKRGESPFPVISAFGGIGLYRGSIFKKGKYQYIPNKKVCEHITLHEQLYRDKYKLGINPSLIALSGIQGGI